MGYCSCLPVYTPGGGGNPPTPTCPPGCLQAASVIFPTEEALPCGQIRVVNLLELTDPGNCGAVTFSVSGPIDLTLINESLTILNDATETGYVTITYTMTCTNDPRSVSGTIQVYVISC